MAINKHRIETSFANFQGFSFLPDCNWMLKNGKILGNIKNIASILGIVGSVTWLDIAINHRATANITLLK